MIVSYAVNVYNMNNVFIFVYLYVILKYLRPKNIIFPFKNEISAIQDF